MNFPMVGACLGSELLELMENSGLRRRRKAGTR
jgi:hypothetical protein